MRIRELITETTADDAVINQTARAVAGYIVDNLKTKFLRSSIEKRPYGALVGELRDFNSRLSDTKNKVLSQLGRYQVYVSPHTIMRDRNWSAYSEPWTLPDRETRDHGIILLNYNQWEFYLQYVLSGDSKKDPVGHWAQSLKKEITTRLAHEIRHALDSAVQPDTRQARDSRYHHEPLHKDVTAGSMDVDFTPQSEVNAWFTQILHDVEDRVKSQKISDPNQAMKLGLDQLKTSDVVQRLGGWNRDNPILRRLVARLSQFVHSLYEP